MIFYDDVLGVFRREYAGQLKSREVQEAIDLGDYAPLTDDQIDRLLGMTRSGNGLVGAVSLALADALRNNQDLYDLLTAGVEK